ncbi:MAG: hypothetical protein MUP47_09210 [Phycisphaerae bacterium]|nr:hypothetical protein [Phycisphaerae bacterium]
MDDAGDWATVDRPGEPARRLARRVLVTFLFTFTGARVLVFLIMSRAIPDLYVHLRGTHVHHLNFGIILLSVTGGWLLMRRPAGRELHWAAVLYGVGLGLTFDEFGMWFHLAGNYWQRASFDAVIVVAAILALAAFAPSLKRLRPRHWTTAVLLAIALAVFIYGLVVSFRFAGRHVGPAIHRLEHSPPP